MTKSWGEEIQVLFKTLKMHQTGETRGSSGYGIRLNGFAPSVQPQDDHQCTFSNFLCWCQAALAAERVDDMLDSESEGSTHEESQGT